MQKLSITEFIQKIRSQLDTKDPGNLGPGTEFRQIPGWSSMQALIIIASFNWEYNVSVSAEEMKEADTLQDLFDLVKNKSES